MTPELREKLEQWLISGTDVEKRHAACRLSQPDANPEYPSLFQQATNVAKAVGTVMASAIRGEAITVPQEEQDRRLAICHACEFWDPAQARCSKCGCFGQWKTWLASQKFPLDPPKW